MIKILIVEDDPNIAKLMEATVAIGGYESEVCNNGAEAFEKIEHENFDLILLDVMLPEISGFEIMRRRTNTEAPVIFITAKQELTDKVRGLRLGAEDYIVKPFEAMELLARIEVILRRVKRTERAYHYGDITVNVEEHTCKCGGEDVYLTPKEFFLFSTKMWPFPGIVCWLQFGGLSMKGRAGRLIYIFSSSVRN